MAAKQRSNLAGTGQTLVLIGAVLLSWNILSTYQTVGFTARFGQMFFVTTGVDGGQSLWVTAYVWGPFILLPIGVLLWILGTQAQRRERERMEQAGDPMGAGFIGLAPGEQRYDGSYGAAAQASFGSTLGGPIRQPDSDAGPEYGRPYNHGDDLDDQRR